MSAEDAEQEEEVEEKDELTVPASGSHFKPEHRSEVLALLAEVRDGGEDAHAAGKLRFHRVRAIFEEYQEQGQLLKAALPELTQMMVESFWKAVGPDADAVRQPVGDVPVEELLPAPRRTADDVEDDDAPRTYVHEVCRLLYTLSKVVGPKTLVPQLPHDVREFELVFFYLVRSVRRDTPRTWEVRYFLLLWLANIVLVPFDFASIDSRVHASIPLAELLVITAKYFLRLPGKERDVSAFLVARLLTRPDFARSDRLPKFLQWCADEIRQQGSTGVGGIGALMSLAQVLKIGRREELLPHLPIVASVLTDVPEGGFAGSNALFNKIHVKATQRLGLVYLAPRVVSWRYQRGLRSLCDNLRAAGVQTPAVPAQPAARAAEEDEEAEAPDEVEPVLDTVLKALRDTDTVVRWSAAKGVGRITARLAKDEAEDVLDAVLDTFCIYEDCNGWHGGCLALAELARRGLLLPDAFERVIPITLRALEYDVAKGSYTVGRHVRDAGCYVCWAFARAYSPQDLVEYVSTMAAALLCTACYDREVNVRRAAAAAFQECVGRLGNFPCGIDIVTTADYFTLSDRRRAYVSIGPEIAAMSTGYLDAFASHVANNRLGHSDRRVRTLAAEALATLADADPEAVVRAQLPRLIGRCTASGVSDVRHGALLACADLLRRHPSTITDDMRDDIQHILPKVEQERLYRGRGGDLVRVAVCKLVQSIAETDVQLCPTVEVKTIKGAKKVRTLARYQESLDEHLRQFAEEVQVAAVDAFRAFGSRYYTAYDERFHGKVVAKLQGQLAESVPANERRGAALALGAFPFFAETHSGIVDALIPCTRVESDPAQRDAETRRNACRALVEAACREPAERPGDVLDALEQASVDYSTDSRGDVGSLVRVAAIESMCEFADALAKRGALQSEQLLRVFKSLLRQFTERLDRVRACAGRLLHRCTSAFLAGDAELEPGVRCLRPALAAFCSAAADVRDWGAPQETFRLASPTLAHPELRRVSLEGFVSAAGGMSVHVARPAMAELKRFVAAAAPDTQLAVARELVAVCVSNSGHERVILPFLNVAEALVIAGLWPDEAAEELRDAVRAETKASSKDIRALLQCCNVLCGLVSVLPSSKRDPALQTMLLLLAGRYPRVRAKAGEALYTALLALPGEFPATDAAVELLQGQQWDKPDAAAVRRARDELYPKLGLQKPAPAPRAAPKAAAQAKPGAAADENAMYSTLIRDMERGDR